MQRECRTRTRRRGNARMEKEPRRECYIYVIILKIRGEVKAFQIVHEA